MAITSKVYPNTVKKVTLALLDVFKNLTYSSRQSDNTIKDQIVPIRFTAAEKMIQYFKSTDVDRRRFGIELPMLSLDMTSIDPNYDENQNQTNQYISLNNTQYLVQPAYYDCTFDLSLWVRQDRMESLWEVVEQVLSKFVNIIHYPFTAYKFLDGSTLNYKLPIRLQSSAMNIKNTDISWEETNVLQITLTFLVTIRIFSAMLGNIKLIEQIDVGFENDIGNKFESMTVSLGTGNEPIVHVVEELF